MSKQTSRRSYIVKAVGSATVIGTLAGCSGDGGGTEEPTPTDTPTGGTDQPTATGEPSVQFPDEIIVGHGSPARAYQHIATYGAFGNVMQDEYGVDVSSQTFGGYSPVIASMVGGDVQVGVGTMPSTINAHLEGFPIGTFATLSQGNSYAFVSSDDVGSWDDLRGMTVAGHSGLSGSDMAMNIMLQEELGEAASEVEKTYIIGSSSRISALEAGEVDGTIVFLTVALQAVKDGIVSGIDGIAWDYMDKAPYMNFTLLDSIIEDQEELYQVFTDELFNAYDVMYNGDIDEIVNGALERDQGFPEVDMSVWRDAVEMSRENEIWPTSTDEILTNERVDYLQNLLHDAEMIEETVDPSEIVDRRFL